jgi:hypothetical protein
VIAPRLAGAFRDCGLDTWRKRKDGMCPIIFRLGHHRKTIAAPTGFAVPPEYWNEENRFSFFEKSESNIGVVTSKSFSFLPKRTCFL